MIHGFVRTTWECTAAWCGRRRDALACVLTFLWPAVFLWQYLIPEGRLSRQSGNDFTSFYYRYKVYLLDFLSRGQLPLWSPSEAAGYPFYSNPFPAAFYPLNLPLALFYRVMGGYSVYDHQIFTILGLCWFSLGLYLWLRSHTAGRRAALCATVVLSCSLKMTELLRLPNALHTAAWLPWILLGCNLAVRRHSSLRGAALVAGAYLMALTAGYPYFLYYYQFLIGPYVLCLLSPTARRMLDVIEREDEFIGLGRSVFTLGLGFLAPLAICVPYLYKMAGLLAQTKDRAGCNFDYSVVHGWGLADTLGSLCYPPASIMEGWFFFGLLSVLVIAYYMLSLRAGSTPPGYRSRESRFLLGMLLWLSMVTLITFGRRSVVFHWLWHYWPGFASLRVWPRLNVLLIPGLALLSARAYTALLAHLSGTDGAEAETARSRLARMASAYVPFLGIQLAFWSCGYVHWYWVYQVAPHHDFLVSKGWFLATGFASFIGLSCILGGACRGGARARLTLNQATCILLALNTLEIAPLSVAQWSTPRAHAETKREVLGLGAVLTKSFFVPRVLHYDTIATATCFNVGTVENWYFERYLKLLAAHGITATNLTAPERRGEGPDFMQLMGMVQGRRLFLVTRLDHDNIHSFLADSQEMDDRCGGPPQMVRYSGDSLEVALPASAPGFLCFIDNWDPDWTARVEGEPVPVERLFGTFKAVRVGPATRNVVFQYQPFRW